MALATMLPTLFIAHFNLTQIRIMNHYLFLQDCKSEGGRMSKKIKTAVGALCFSGLLVFAFLCSQHIVTKYYVEYTDRVLTGFNQLDDSNIDVLFLGPSAANYAISPMALYRESGIKSYNLSTPGQPLAVSYYLLEYAYERHENIPMVILDIGWLYPDEAANGSWRFALDNMKWGPAKFGLAKTYAEQGNTDSLLSVIFPIIEYHNRYNELTDADFSFRDNNFYYTGGQKISTYAVPATITNMDVNTEVEHLIEENTGFSYKITDGKEQWEERSDQLYNASIPSENIDYLKLIKQLCEQHGTKCAFIKIPTIGLYTQYPLCSWSKDKYLQTRNVMDSLAADYYDLEYEYDLNLDYSRDTLDGGLHINSTGAEKVTKFLLDEIIRPSVSIGSKAGSSDAIYDKALQLYEDAMVIADIEGENDFRSYISKISTLPEDYLVLCAVKDEFTSGLTEDDITTLKLGGFPLVDKAYWGNSYVSILKSGETEPLYSELSNRRIEYATSVNGSDIYVSSAGHYCGDSVSIRINGNEYAINSTGMCFVIFDTTNQVVVDAVTFNTNQIDHTAWHYNYFESYQDKVLFKEKIG